MTVKTPTKSITYRTGEVAEKAGVSRRTVIRWYKTGKVPAPNLDRNHNAVFTASELKVIVEYANTLIPPSEWRRGAERRGA